MIDWTSDENIHRIVKRDIPHTERSTVSTLNDLPDWMLEEARALARASRLSAVRYLRFYVATQYVSSAEDFTEDVLLKGQDAKTWRIRDCICHPVDRAYTTALEIHYLDTLASEDGERWFRIKPNQADPLSSWSAGAVGVLKRNVRYWHPLSDVVGNYPVTPEDIESIPSDRVDSSVRRWIARRLAWSTQAYLQEHWGTVTGNDIIAAVPDVDLSRVTPDAKIAAAALAREAQAFGGSPSFPQQAGFLGPEEWYQ